MLCRHDDDGDHAMLEIRVRNDDIVLGEVRTRDKY